MAGKYTDEERIARGQYQDDNGDWYTSSGYKIRMSDAAPVRDEDETAAYLGTGTNSGLISRGDEPYRAQIDALESAMQEQRDALKKAYSQNAEELQNSTAAAKRQAYAAKMQGLRDLPAAMGAAGYHGGVTETAAQGLETEYQNALTSLENEKASALAKLQADLANNVASNNAGYLQQIAAAEQAAQDAILEQKRLLAQQTLENASAAQRKTYTGTGSNTGLYETGENDAGGSAADIPSAAVKMTAAQALREASQTADPLTALRAMYEAGQIDKATYTNLRYSMQNPGR